MILMILISFSVLVMVIAIVTAIMNTKSSCEHEWEEFNSYNKCSKCNRVISRGRVESEA